MFADEICTAGDGSQFRAFDIHFQEAAVADIQIIQPCLDYGVFAAIADMTA